MLSALLCFAALVSARLVHHSLIPEDPHAFPKFNVAFLNGLPVLNDTAQRWLRDGLPGGELEFLNEPWHNVHPPSNVKGIDGAPEVCTLLESY